MNSETAHNLLYDTAVRFIVFFLKYQLPEWLVSKDTDLKDYATSASQCRDFRRGIEWVKRHNPC